MRRWIDSRFNKDEVILENGAAFDMVRAAVNLVLSGLLIIIGTTIEVAAFYYIRYLYRSYGFFTCRPCLGT